MAVFSSALLAACLLPSLAIVAQGQAPAPAPAAAANNTVDGVLTVTASVALFSNATTLELTGIPNTTEYIRFPPRAKAGALTQNQFASPSMSSGNGTWLGGPQSALSGTYNGQPKTVLLKLSMPVYNPSTNMLAFQYVVLASNQTSLLASGGTVNDYATQGTAAEGNAATTLPYITPGSTTFYNASLAIDVVGIDRYLQGAEKAGLIRVDLGAYNGGYYGYYGR